MDTSDTESNSTYEDNSGNYLEYVLRLCVIGIVLDSATYIVKLGSWSRSGHSLVLV